LDVANLSDLLSTRLAEQGRPERADGEKRYLKSTLTHLGVGMPALRRTTRQFLREHDLDLPTRLALAEELWRRPVYELRRAAVEVLVCAEGELLPRHLDMVEGFLREANTWALVDPLATEVAGAVAAASPDARPTFDRWIAADDFWVRRAALLAHLRLLRTDPDRFDLFATYADRVLDEREFFIRKAIGWVLRETGRRAPQHVIGWLEPRITRVSGITIREAVKHLPEADAARLLGAYRART
jgi:3-methyladenine DNA glycosylase AlkD